MPPAHPPLRGHPRQGRGCSMLLMPELQPGSYPHILLFCYPRLRHGGNRSLNKWMKHGRRSHRVHRLMILFSVPRRRRTGTAAVRFCWSWFHLAIKPVYKLLCGFTFGLREQPVCPCMPAALKEENEWLERDRHTGRHRQGHHSPPFAAGADWLPERIAPPSLAQISPDLTYSLWTSTHSWTQVSILAGAGRRASSAAHASQISELERLAPRRIGSISDRACIADRRALVSSDCADHRDSVARFSMSRSRDNSALRVSRSFCTSLSESISALAP